MDKSFDLRDCAIDTVNSTVASMYWVGGDRCEVTGVKVLMNLIDQPLTYVKS